MGGSDHTRCRAASSGGRLPSLTELTPLLEAQLDCSLPRGPVRALDLACGLGRNTLELAEMGYAVTAVDLADAALDALALESERRGLDVHPVHADLDTFRPAPASYDLVIDTYFLDRRLWPSMSAALRGGGLISVETFTVDRRFRAGLRVPRTRLLERGELAGAFPGLDVLLYQERCDAGVATLLGCNPLLDERIRRHADGLGTPPCHPPTH